MANIEKESVLTQEYVKEIFDYKDGFLYWKKLNPGNYNGKAKIGEKAGSVSLTHSGPRRMVRIKKYTYYTSRIIFFYHHGYFPEFVDHKDRDKSNEKIDNLRAATASENSRNRTSNKGSSSKYLGVSYCQRTTRRILKTTGEMGFWSYPRWAATITIAGKFKHLGYFKTEIEAAIAFNSAAKEHYKEFANLNVLVDDNGVVC